MSTNELSVREKWGGLFYKKTGERLPESAEEVDKIVAKFHRLKELPIVSRSIFPAVDMKSVDKEIDEFVSRGVKNARPEKSRSAKKDR